MRYAEGQFEMNSAGNVTSMRMSSANAYPSRLYMGAVSTYIPSLTVDNAYFSGITGRSSEWFRERTGIESRSRAGVGEDAGTMAVSSVAKLLPAYQQRIKNVDLIIGASYTPFDTVGTIAHRVQSHFGIADAKAFFLSSACSSFLNSLEIADAFFQTQKARSALIVVSEHNSGFADDHDCQSGHLWGDGAASVLLDSQPGPDCVFEVLDVDTRGLGHLGDGPDGVYLRPTRGGLVMQNGRDVFNFACREMTSAVQRILAKNSLSVGDVAQFIPHQANLRIIEKVAENLKFPLNRVLTTIRTLGNTGCASVPITLATFSDEIKLGDMIVIAAFGGGYSSGAAVMRCVGENR